MTFVFYHSNEDKKIIGIVKIIKSAFIDPTDKEKKFVAVKVAYYKDLVEPVSLADIKENKEISHLPLIKQSRLSVMPIDSIGQKILTLTNHHMRLNIKNLLTIMKNFGLTKESEFIGLNLTQKLKK